MFSNTVKHAGATRVSVSFHREGDWLTCVYKDNGKGLDSGKPGAKHSPGIGMRNIESRLGMIGATYHIQDPEEKGFGMLISIPA